MHGLSSISASWSRSKLKTKNTKPMWDHSHINNDTHRLPHIWPYIFTPLHQPKTPVFAKNCHPKSQCHTVYFITSWSKCPEFWKFFTQRPLIGWNLRKGTQMPPILLWLLSLKDPLFFYLAYTCLFEGNVASNTERSWKILYSRNRIEQLGNTLRCKFNKGDENKISFLQAQPTQLCIIWINFIGGQGWYRLLST